MGIMVRNVTRCTALATAAQRAGTPWARLVGLIGRKGLPPGTGLLLPRTPAVHTLFMRFPIDLVFVDRTQTVVAIVHRLPPWRLSPLHWSAADVIELPAGAVTASGTQVGDRLAVTNAE
jgi:uncharacterized membrane protein (UPF0127 family)